MSNSFKARIITTPQTVTRKSVALTPSSAVDSRTLALAIAEAADDRKGADIALLKVSDVSYLTDYFVVVSGFSSVQVKAIARSIEDTVYEKWQRLPLQSEGKNEGNWVLIDYGEVIAHIFLPKEREFYNLEAFWGHAERTPYPFPQSIKGSGPK
ncbi:MAG TPA: ribosome silencing factor [Chroococcidiopsis sp.]